MGADAVGLGDALPWQRGDEAIAAKVVAVLDGGAALALGDLLDRLPRYPAEAVRRVVDLLFRAGTLTVDSASYPPRYRLS